VFWAWPCCTTGRRPLDLWLGNDVHQHFEKWLARDKHDTSAVFAVQNRWAYDDAPEDAVIREKVTFTVHPAVDDGRVIDVDLVLTNVSKEVVTLLGQTHDDKGYGGFCVRLDSKRNPQVFSSALGLHSEDALWLDTPWVDATSATPEGERSGVAIFQHPENPGYVHSGWILRHYGFLGASWPHLEPFALSPGAHVRLRYRLYVHRGSAREARVAGNFRAYVAEHEGSSSSADPGE